MKVLLVNGSPHKRGCTHTALSLVASALEEEGIETEEFWIGTKPIVGCLGCYRCREQGHCVFDDVVGAFQDAAEQADGFVFGSPVHYGGMAGGMKSFMDRAFFSGCNRNLFRLKPAANVVSARRAGTTSALEQMDKYLQIEEMPVAVSRYWNLVHGNTPEEVMQDKEGVQVMQVLGRNLAWMLKAISAADAAGIARPEKIATRVSTNFIR